MNSRLSRWILAGVLLPLVHGSPASAQAVAEQSSSDQQAKLTAIAATYTNLLRTYGLAPIIVPRGERVGDAFTPNGTVLIASSDECFPKLVPRRTPAQLPTVMGTNARGLAAALGVADITTGDLMIGMDNDFELSFKDVEAIIVSVHQLRAALNDSVPECAFVGRFLKLAEASFESQRPSNAALPKLTADEAMRAPVIIGTLFVGRRVLSISSSAKRDAKASLDLGQSLLKRIGLSQSFTAKADASRSDTSKVQLVGEQVVPVAFRPAFQVVRSDNPSVTLESYKGQSLQLARNATNPPKVDLTSGNLGDLAVGNYSYLVDPDVDGDRFQDFAKAAFTALVRQ